MRLTLLREQLALWVCLVLPCTLIAGCAGQAPTDGEVATGEPQVLYESEGRVLAVEPFGSERRDRVLIAHVVRPSPAPLAFRVVGLSVPSGEQIALWDQRMEILPGSLAITGDGQLALMVGVPDDGDGAASHSSFHTRYVVFDAMAADETGRFPKFEYALTPEDEEERFWRLHATWSPKGDALAYWRMTGLYDTYEGVVAHVPRRAGEEAERVVVPDGYTNDVLIWSVDGSQLYHLRHMANPREESTLTAISWPSLKRRELVTAKRIKSCGVAGKTGDLVFLIPAERSEIPGRTKPDVPAVAWRLSPDDVLSQTASHLPQWPTEAAMSPDGACLAVISPRDPAIDLRAANYDESPFPGDRLLLYWLDNGTATSIEGFGEKNLGHIRWVLDGGGIVYLEDEKTVWFVPVDVESARQAARRR